MPDLRPLTALARRRAWGELGVRPWTFLTLLMLLAAVVLTAVRWKAWRHEVDVVNHGTPVKAEVLYIGLSLLREGNRDEQLTVALNYTTPDGIKHTEQWGQLPRKPGTSISAKQFVDVKVDPNQPTFWTERTEAPPVTLVMITPLICLGVAIACGLIALARRQGSLRAYQLAEPRRATVVSVKQSPLAPFSKLVGVALDNAEDRRVRTLYWPNKLGPVHPKQVIEALVHKGRAYSTLAYGEKPTTPGDVLG